MPDIIESERKPADAMRCCCFHGWNVCTVFTTFCLLLHFRYSWTRLSKRPCISNVIQTWWTVGDIPPADAVWTVKFHVYVYGSVRPFGPKAQLSLSPSNEVLLLFLYSWTRLSKERAAKCHALVCSNVIQTSATLGDFTLSSAWRVRQCLSLDSMGQLPHLGHWQTFLKFKHRHMAHVMGVLVHYGTKMSCTTCMGYKFTANPLQHALIFFNFQK